jgi:hypothetical protein
MAVELLYRFAGVLVVYTHDITYFRIPKKMKMVKQCQEEVTS